MNTADAQKLAREQMTKHGLTLDKGWEFEWDECTKRYGSCSVSKKRITLSSRLVAHNSLEQTTDTILHEIAHALDWMENKQWGHGPSWKRVCVRIGAKPVACFTFNDVNPVTGRFRLINKDTGAILHVYNIAPKFPKGIWNYTFNNDKSTLGKLKLEIVKTK